MYKFTDLTATEMSAQAKSIYVESVARSLDELAEKLQDREFSAAMASDPKLTLESSGIVLEREAIELMINTDPQRFDALCDKLFGVMDPDLLHQIAHSSCD